MTNVSSNGTLAAARSPITEIAEKPKRRRFSLEERRRILCRRACRSRLGNDRPAGLRLARQTGRRSFPQPTACE